MSDFDHELIFGTFITPYATPPEHPVQLAVLSERVGLDIVGIQDHPYEPRLQDAWTLMSVVAAVTERVRVTSDVLNVPLRQPSMIARAAASLDRMSGGRVEIGLGAGGFWDGIVGMGAQRQSIGDSIASLEEAVAILRGVWDGGQPGPFTYEGTFYSVRDMQRGPTPAHRIPIGIGAHKPRMLRLTGRIADTWLPTLAYLPGGLPALAEASRYVDEGADQAGRPGRSIVRYLNFGGRFTSRPGGEFDGPPEHWAQQIATVALELGVSGFLVQSDDPTDIERFAGEVAPRVREIVGAERR